MLETQASLQDQELLLKEKITNYNKCADQVEVLSGVTVQQEKEIRKLQEKLDNIEANANRHKLIISGLIEKEGENVTHEVLAFFKAKLRIDMTIELRYARRVGQGDTRAVEVGLMDIGQKGLIYKSLKNLKDIKNEKGFTYQVWDHLPEHLQEEDYRRRKIMTDNRIKARRNTAHKIDMSMKRNQLYMNNTLFKKQAPAPTAQDLLNMTDADRECIQGARLAAMNIHREKGNKFIAYVLEAGDIEEVRSTYKHLKLKHADSTHVAVTYNIAGENPELCDHEDNGEICADARMLKIIMDGKHTNVAIFLVRYHSGQNLGVRRFAIIKDLTTEALSLLSDRENFFVSRLPKAKLVVRLPKGKNLRTRGKVFGGRGGSHAQRGGFQASKAYTTQSESERETMDTDTKQKW